MAFLVNDATSFARQAADGLAAAHPTRVVRVDGGVVRAGGTAPGTVAVVVGGGSGHYPAFGGLVGRGLAAGAALGDLFASPSARQVYAVARAAHAGAGVLLTYGNYAGDVLNFDQAQDMLRADGIACETVAVTDDVASAPPELAARRRGIAGDLVVFKAAAATADSGAPLERVLEVASRANRRTRSLGVAFGGCTLPGASEPLFTVPKGQMALGMGIHGEPGLELVPAPAADELADLLVTRLLAERPADGTDRVTVLLSGLGSISGEELYVLYGRVAQLLGDHGLVVVEPEVGELVTSFEMAGVSLTIGWLDDELEAAWRAPADAPAFRRGSLPALAVDDDAPRPAPSPSAAPAGQPVPAATGESRAAATCGLAALAAAAVDVEREADRLGALDAVAGDGDHGIGMLRGVRAAHEAAASAVAAGAGLGTTLRRAGDAWADLAGGTSGALWGLILRSLADAVGDDERPGAAAVARGAAAASRAVSERGGATVGDKTLLDALDPFARELGQAAPDEHFAGAWRRAALAAERAAERTASLLPRAGRARTHAEHGLGTPDPGAVSMAVVLMAASRVFEHEE